MSHVTQFNDSHKSAGQTRPCVLCLALLNALHLLSSSLVFLSSSSRVSQCPELLLTSQTEPWERRRRRGGREFICYLKRSDSQWVRLSRTGGAARRRARLQISQKRSRSHVPPPPGPPAVGAGSDLSDQPGKGISDFCCGKRIPALFISAPSRETAFRAPEPLNASRSERAEQARPTRSG